MERKRIRRSIWSIAIVFTFLFGMFVLSGCIGQEEEPETITQLVTTTGIQTKTEVVTETRAPGEFDAKVAVVFATGGLGDQSFNDAAMRGLMMAKSAYNIYFEYVEPFEIADYDGYLKAYAARREFDLIISIGFDQAGALKSTAELYPDQKYAIVDMVVFPDLPENNIRSIVYKEHEGSALVGAAAGFLTTTDKIGFVGGMDIWLIQKFLWGYRFGAEYVNPDVEVISTFVGAWADIPKGKTLAEDLLAQDVDIIYAAAGRSGIGAWQAVEATTDAYSIGVDSDVCLQGYVRMAASMLKMVDLSVKQAITDVIEGTWSTGIMELGILENGVGICEHLTRFHTADQIAQIEALRDAIANGEVVVPVPPT